MKILICVLASIIMLFSCEKETEDVFALDNNQILDKKDVEINNKVGVWECGIGSGGTTTHLSSQNYLESVIFQEGTNGYHSYRIPSIVKTTSGTLIAFCEGRKNSRHDYGDVDVVYRRSTNHGVTWGPLQVLFSKHGGTCGNPTAVVDQDTGGIWIFMSYQDEFHAQFEILPNYQAIDDWGERRVYSNVSYDDGVTWNNLQNRTSQLLPLTYTWDAIGPGNGIQLKYGAVDGRLVIPAIGRNIFSDDNGATWDYQLITPGTSEGTISELCNGDLVRNDRAALSVLKNRKRRQISVSSDDGLTWTDWESNNTLLDPLCQASILRYNDSYPPRLVFINPATTIGGLTNRKKMRARISYDDGETWPVSRELDADNGGYSSLVKTSDYNVASLQELNVNSGNSYSIIFRKFNLSWILNGTVEPVY